MHQHVVGLDVGHSAVKIAVDTSHETIQSAAAPAIELTTDSAKAAAKASTVSLGKEKWLVGDPALVHTFGRVADGLRDDWITTKEFAALLKAGYERASHLMGGDAEMVVVGLPSRLFSQQYEKLLNLTGATLGLDKDSIRVVPQPYAAFYVHAMNADGTPALADLAADDYAIIDVGYYTTDFGYIAKGQWSEAGAQSMHGVYSAAESMQRAIATELGKDLDVRKCDSALRAKSIRIDGKVVDLTAQAEAASDTLAHFIMERAERVFRDWLHDSAKRVLVVGGGAPLVYNALKKQWGHTEMPDDPRFAVAEGMRRYGTIQE